MSNGPTGPARQSTAHGTARTMPGRGYRARQARLVCQESGPTPTARQERPARHDPPSTARLASLKMTIF